jgi:uncharacterized protein
MTEALPRFRFHTDPPALTSVEPSALTCACCGTARGYRVNSNYGPVSYDCICPWCVADGSAHARLDASFVQDIWGDVAPELADELHQRNPGYESWQGENWPAHCGEPCIFHGDLPQHEILALPPEAEALFLAENDWIDFWDDLKASYSGGNAHEALYKFVCGQCGLWRITIDFT